MDALGPELEGFEGLLRRDWDGGREWSLKWRNRKSGGEALTGGGGCLKFLEISELWTLKTTFPMADMS